MYTGDFRAFHLYKEGNVAVLDATTITALEAFDGYTRIYTCSNSAYVAVKETIPQIFAIIAMDGNTQINNVLNENAITPEPIMKVEKPNPKISRWVKWAESVDPSYYRTILCSMGRKQCPLAHKGVSCFIPDEVARYMQEVDDDN